MRKWKNIYSVRLCKRFPLDSARDQIQGAPGTRDGCHGRGERDERDEQPDLILQIAASMGAGWP
jgi:hypothetical protein